jgi:hypothetical protein
MKNKLNSRFLTLGIFTALLVVHFVFGLNNVRRFTQDIVHSYLTYFNVPVEDRIFSTSMATYYTIQYIRKTVPENAAIYWAAKTIPPHFVHYYCYPRRIFCRWLIDLRPPEMIKDPDQVSIDPSFMVNRDISYIFAGPQLLYKFDRNATLEHR